eukprot:scaffold4340_cov123-Isochrysis_galbana.AAC.4
MPSARPTMPTTERPPGTCSGGDGGGLGGTSEMTAIVVNGWLISSASMPVFSVIAAGVTRLLSRSSTLSAPVRVSLDTVVVTIQSPSERRRTASGRECEIPDRCTSSSSARYAVKEASASASKAAADPLKRVSNEVANLKAVPGDSGGIGGDGSGEDGGGDDGSGGDGGAGGTTDGGNEGGERGAATKGGDGGAELETGIPGGNGDGAGDAGDEAGPAGGDGADGGPAGLAAGMVGIVGGDAGEKGSAGGRPGGDGGDGACDG